MGRSEAARVNRRARVSSAWEKREEEEEEEEQVGSCKI